MYFTQKISLRTLLLIAILAGGLFDGLGLAGIIDVWAFSRQWGESWGSDHRGDWDEYKIGDCGGQNHSVSGGALHMDASYGTDCFGAYYRENGNHPGMFPRNQDIRVMWRWRYPDREKYGSQAGQVTGRYGGPQYYGMSAVDTGGSGNSNDSWHVVTQGPWGTQTVDNSPKYGTDTGWHVSTFDWLCDGAMMKWWLDNDNFQTRSSSSYALPANHESRPWQFWQGNLMTSVPGSGSWTPFDIDYLHIYAVERPQLNTPASGGGGVQPVSWSSVPNSTQPDGTAWGVQYQVQACNNSSCSSIQQSSPWLDSTSYTFTGLPLNQTYTYRARARWLGTPSLETCWGNSVSASMTGAPELELSQLAPAQAQYGDTIIYSLTVKNTGDAPATNVVVTDSPPAYVRLPGSSPSPGSPMAVQVFNGGSYSNGQIRWQIGSLAPGQRVTVSWWTGLEAAVPTAVDQLTNTPRATADGGLDVSAPATTQILHPNISLTKSGPATSFPGDTISYQIEVENTGSGRALESWLFDTTAAGFDQPNGDLETVRDISPDGSYIGAIDQLDGVSFTTVCAEPQDQVWYVGSAKPTLVWSFDRLEAGEKQTLTFSAAVNPDLSGGSAIDNKAQLCHWHAGPEPGDLVSTPLIAPQLDLSKSAPAEIWVGDPFSYQITAHNSGSVPVVEPAIYDIVPDYIINPTNISEGYGLSSSIDPFGDVTMTIGWDEPQRLEPGQAATYRWDFAVDPDTPADVTEITNHALATAAGGLSEQAQAISTLLFAVMELSKSATPVVYPGAPISYTIRVANSGGAVMQQVVITDTIPPYVTGISGISHGGQRLGDEIVWHLANIAGSSQLDLSWHGQIDPNIPRYETEIINRVAGTALATGDTAETRSSLTYPQMTLTKSGPANSSPGQPLEYTLVVENSGDAPMLDVSVRDPVPAYLVDVDVPAGTLTGGVASWEFSRLEPGERQELIWRATVAPDIPDSVTLLLNRASGTALGGIEERAEAATSLQFPRLTLDKQAPAEVWPGGQIEYAVHVENSGVVALEELVIRDFIPDYVLDPVDISHGGLVDGQEIVWQLGDLAPGAAYDLVWRGTVDPAIPQARSVIRNQVQGRAAHGVSRVAEATSLVLFPALVVGKQGPAQAGPGDPVQYVIEVHNASAAPVDGVVVVDHIPEYITQPGSISGGGRVEGADIIWELGRLGGGQSRTLLWEGVIDGAVPLGRSYLDNTVTVCDESGRFCDEALYRMPLLQAEARLTKAATPYGHPGSEVEYVIRLQNSGETELEELVIRDPLPPYLEYPHDISGGGQALPSPFEDEIAVVWRLERLAVGELVELRWRGRIALDIPPGVDAIQNRVTVTDRRGLQREAAGSTYVMHPQLRLRKQATPQAGPGEEIDYTLTLENPGQVPAYELELVDLIPTYILTPTQISGGGLLQAADISWRFAELAAGQVVSLTWQGTVDPQIPAAVEQINNTARASNPAGLLAEDTALTDLSGQLLALRKTATAMVEPGGEVVYALEVENRGQAAVTGLTLTDPIPAYVESPAEISGGGSAANNVAVSWEIERLEAGQTYRVGWQGVVARDIPAKEAEILNEARLTSASGLALTAQARSLVRQPRLALDKSATLTAGPGEVITTVLTVRNLGGGTAYDVAVSDPLPAYLTAESGGPGVELAADRVTWALVGGLLPGASRSLTWTGRVDPLVPFDQTEIVNEATATASGGQLATAQAVTDLKAQRLSLRKDASEVVSPGGSVVYTITVENRGQATIYDVLVSDPVPEMVRDVRDISGGGELAGNDRLRWELPQLLPGQTISVTWRGSVVADLASNVQTLWNEARLESGSGLAAEARAKSLVRRPLLTLEKTATPLAGPGELIYTVLTVRNRGEAPAYDITITDPLPEYLEVVSVSEGGSDQGDAVSWQLAELAPGETVVLDWYGRVARDVPATLTEISSRARLETPDGSRAEAGAVTRLKRQQVQLVKQASALVYAGGPVSYTLTVENQGEAVLYDLALTDPLPAFVQEGRLVAATSGAAQVEGNRTVAWHIPALAAGEGLTLTWAGVVARDIPAKETEIVNEAGLMSAGGSSAQAQAASRLAQPLLTLDKTATLQTGPTGRIDYTLTLANQGSAPAYDVELLDPVPDYLEQVASPNGEIRAEAVRWRFEDLAAGESKTLSWSASVAEDVPVEVAEIVNVATARDGAGREVEAGAVTNLIQPGAPLVTKAATYEVYPGGVVSYTITLRNPGDAALFDVMVTDPIPDYVENPTAVSGGGNAASGLDVIWQIDRIEAGETVSLTWQGAVARSIPAKETEIANQVTVETANGLHRTAQARSYVRQPQLTLDKTASLEAGPGGPIEYTLTLANRGLAPAYDVVVTDSIPDHLERVASPDGEVQAEAVRWRFEELAAGEMHTLTWSAFVAEDIAPDVAEIVNLATARDGAGREIEASAVTNLIQPDVPLVSKAATYDVYPGGTVGYTITLRNPGGTALYDVTVTDPIPDYVENPAGISGGGQIEGNTILVWRLDQVTAGETVSLTWQGTVAASIPAKETEITSQVTVETANGLRRTAQARSFVRQPQLTLDKTATLEAGPGGRIDYTLTLANRGLAPAYEVELLDPIPEHLERAASPDGEVQAEAVRWRFAELPAGASKTLTWSAFVAEAVPPDVAEIVNLAIARDGAGREIEASAVTNLIQPGAPLVTKAATYDVYPGGTVAYTVTLRNAGQTALFDLVVTDPIPDYVENPAAVSGGGQIEGNSALVWWLDQLTAGETVSLTWQGTVAASIPAKETEIASEVTVETANGLRRTAQARSFVRQPQLTLDKTATLEAGPGGRIDYTLTLANRGQAPAYEVELLDPIPEHLERAASPDGEVQANAVRWRFAELPAGAVETLTWSAFVAEDVPAELAEIVNVAAVRDGAGRLVEADAVTNLSQPDAPLLLQEATYRIYPGGVVSYTISLHNGSPQALYDLAVRNPVPTYVLAPTALSAGGRLEGNTALVWQLAALAPGETTRLGWQGQVARDIPPGVGEVASQVTVETAGGLRSAAQAVSFVQRPQLLIDLAATLSAGPGDMIEYILQIGNPGQAPAYDVAVQASIPTYILGAASPGGEVGADAVRWRFAELPAGAVETLTWTGFVDPDSPATLEQIASAAAIADAAGNQAEATAVTDLPAQMVSLRQAASYEVYPGGTVAYTLTVQNRSQSRLSEIVVRQPAPTYVLAPTAISHDGFLAGNLAIVWELVSLAPDATETLTWQGTVDPAVPAAETTLLGQATLTSGSGLTAQAQAKSWLRRPQLILRLAGPTQAAPGERIDYALTLENSGQAPAYSVEIRNPLPEQLTGPASPDGAVLGDAVVWQLDRLEPGEQRALSWQGEVARDVPASLAEIINRATARDQTGQQIEAQVVTRLIQPELWLAKTAPQRLSPGGTAVYTLTVSNPGQVPLYDITVSDPLPGALVPPLTVADGGQLQGASLIWQLPLLAPGERRDLHWSGGIDPTLPETEQYLWNEATAMAAGGLTARAEARSWLARPLLRLSQLATPESGAGGLVVYTLTVRNDGLAPAYGVTVNDPIPDYVEQAASPDGQVQAGTIRWQVAALAPGQSKTLTWRGSVQADVPPDLSEIINQATATDAAGSVVAAQATTRLLPQRLDLTQAATLRSYPGGTVVYTLTVTNRGAGPLAGVKVRNPIPAGVIDPASISGNGQIEGNLAVVWNLDALAAGQSRVLTWQGTIDLALPATVSDIRSETTATTAGGLTERVETRTWLRRSLLRLDKLATPESGAGGLLVYTLTVRNDGLAPAYGVTLTDPIPDYVEQVASPAGQVQAEAVRWQFDQLAAGQSKTLTWQGKIRGDVPSDLTGIVNQATATDAAGSAVTAQATTRLLPQRLDLAHTATYQSYPGGTVAYTLTVTNRGAVPLTGVTVRDSVPNGLINPTAVSSDGQLEGNLAVIWKLDTLAAGQSRVLTWQGTVDPALPAAVIDVRSEATATTAGGLAKRTETRTWLARPRLRLDKLATPESGAGGPVVYTLTLRNDGLAPAYEVTVTDPLPDYVVDPTADSEATVQAKAVRWQIGELAGGQSKTLTWRGIVQADAPASLAEIVNQATATDAAGNEVTAQATTRLLPQKLALAQATTLRSYPGGTVIYTLTVTNRGAAGLASVTVRSPIPSGVIDPTGISSGGQLEGNLAVVWQLDALPAGQSQTLTWQGTVDPDLPAAVSDIRSEATATTAGGLTKRAETRTWLRQPALEIGYTASREAGPGEPVVYRITVKNNGPVPAFDLTVAGSIPADVTSPTAAQSGDIRTEAIVWRLDNLAVGEEKVLSWQGTVAEDISAALAQLASSVTASRGDEQISAQASTWLKAQAVSLAIAAGDQLYPGAVVTYTLVAKNEGQATLYDVRLRNPLPPYVRYISGGQIEGNEAVTWQLPRLAAGEVVSLTWQGSLAGDLPAQVTAVKTEAALSTAGGLTAHAQATSLIARPRLRLDQTAPFQAGPGEVITYALTVRNLGPAPAYDLRVENPLPDHIIDPAGLSGGGRIAGNLALLWNLDSLAAGQSKTLTWRGTVDPAVSERTGQIVNRAMVEDGSGLSDEAQAVTTLLERRVDLMGAASLRSYPGGPLVYTLTVRNSGQAALDDITVTNPLPEYVSQPVSDSGQLAGNRAVSWQIPRLAAGERLELGWQAEVARTVPWEIAEIQSEASLVTGSGLTAQTEMRTVLQHPALLLEKWASRQAGPGEMVDFQLTLRNVGQAPAYDLTLTDPIPAYIVRPTGALSGEVRAEAVVWRLDELPAGQQRTFSWQGQVAETVPDEVRQIGSTASLRDRAGDRAEAEALTWLRRQGVRLLKAASPQIYPGGPAVFTLTVENPGDTTLYGIAVSDPIPDHILGPVAVSEGGQVIGNEAVLWRLPGLAAGEHQTLTWRGTVAKDVPDGVSDIGSDASLTAGGLAASAGATSRLGRPRLILDSRATPQAGPGETVIYTLTVANPGSAPAYAVEVRQPIPDHLLDAGSPTGQVQADAITWRFPELAAGETRTLIWQGRVDSAVPAELAQLGSPATVEDASGQSDTAWAATDLLAQRLHLAQEATPLAGPGGTIAYTLTLRNLGQADLYDLTVSSPRPDHILAPTAISNGGRLAGNRALRWEVARLTSGQVLTLSWQGAVDPVLPADQSDIRSMASVSTRSGLAAEAQARTRLLRPSLRLAALAPATIGPGDLISYTLLVENAGQVPAVGLELRDPIPAAIREPDAISGAGFVDHLPAYAVRWKLGDLGPGQRRTVSWQGRVAPQLLTGTTHLTNSVIAQAAGGVSAQALVQTRLLHPRFELGALVTPQAGPGETVVYTLVLTNTGQIPVRELLVSQPLPDHLTPIETGGALRESDPLGRPLLRWPLAPLTIAETRVITWLGRIDLSVPPALGWLDSRVTATASSAGERQATTAIRLQRPQLSLAKRVSPAHVAAGDRLTYTLVVTGSGPVTAFDVTLTDQLPDQMALLTAGDGGQLQSSALRWWLGDLRPGEVRQVSWQGQLTAAAPLSLAELRSQAVVTAAAGARATAWRSAVVRQPALALSLSGPAWVQPGETVQYGVVLTNTGQAMASSVRLTDTLPLSATLLDAPGGVISDGIVVWALGDLAANESQRVTMQVRLEPDLPPGPVLNRAEATAARGLTAQASSAAALRQPQLRLSQQAAGLASPGSLLTYTLQLHNRGDGLARTVVLTNPLPNHLDFVSASPPATLTGRILRWQPGLLATGAGFEARWTGRLALALPETAAAITNTAWAASSDLARPVTATAVLPTLPPQISAQMICPPTGQVGDVLTYTLRLHNRGGTLLTPTLALTLPPGTVYQPGSATLGGRLATGRRDVWGSPLPDQVQWHLPALYPDGRLQPRLALTVTSALSDVVWTEAKLTSHGRRSAAHFGCLTALHRPRLALAKQGPARALVGEVIEWRLSLTNSGRVTAYNPVLTDTLPPGLSYVPDSAPGVTVLTRTQPGGGWPETLLRWQAADLSPGQSLVRTFRTTVTLPLELAGYPLPFNAQNEAALENRAAAATDGAAPVTAAHLLLVPRPTLTLTRQAAVETGQDAVLYVLEASGNIGLAGPAAQPLRLAALSDPDEPPVAVGAVQAWPGSRIRHTLRGANLGPGLARQATLVEQVPAGLEVLTGTISHGGQYDPLERAISWALGELIEGEQRERSYTLAVPLSLRPDLAALEHNRAELRAVEAPAVFAAAATTLDDDLTLAVVKNGPATAAPGAELEYLIRVQNVNRSPLDQVTITDPLPAYTRYLTASASLPPELQAGGRTMRWNLGLLHSGQLAEVRFKVRVDEDLPDWVLQLHNRAAVTWTGGGPVTAETTSRLPEAALPPTPTPTTTAPPPPGDDDDSSVAPPPPPPPMETPILRTTAVVSPLVTATPSLTPTGIPATAAPPTATPRPQPLLRKTVSTDTVPAGALTVLTWQLTFSNPTPLTIVDLLVRDLLPPGLLYLEAETSRGVVEVSPRSVYGRRARPGVTPTASLPLTPRPTRPSYLTAEQARLVIRPAAATSDTLASPTARVYTVLPAKTVTAATVTATPSPEPVWPGLDLADLPGTADVPPTEVLFRLGDLAPGSRVRMTIRTLVLTDARAGTRYDNVATFAAANMDPGISNRVSVSVVSDEPLFILPVTGGLLELIDPRTAPGKAVWLLLALVGGGLIWYRKKRR